MPVRRRDSHFVTRFQLGAGAGSGGVFSTTRRTGTSIVIEPDAWTADDALYLGAPDMGMCYYADVVHNLGTEETLAVAWRDADGHVHAGQTFIDQATTPDDEAQSIRVWLSQPVMRPITVYVQAFA